MFTNTIPMLSKQIHKKKRQNMKTIWIKEKQALAACVV